MDESQLERIRKKLAQKSIVLGACLSESEIVQFESKWDIRLPDEYRDFLQQVGNGGRGPPDYDMYRLGVVPHYERDEAERLFETMKLPFPLNEYWVWEGDPEAREADINRVFQGQLRLGTDGCGMYWVLILTGDQRGRIWYVSGGGAQPCVPKRGFLSWYEYWLDGGKDYFAKSKADA